MPHYRQETNNDDGEDDRREVVIKQRDFFYQIVPAEGESCGPDERACNVVGNEVAIVHPCDSRDDWRKGAHDRNEARKHDRLYAMCFVK